MLAGETPPPQALAAEDGIRPDAAHADLRPQDKARNIREPRNSGSDGTVEDGSECAPALATADVGIAMRRWARRSRSNPPMPPSLARISDILPRHSPTPG